MKRYERIVFAALAVLSLAALVAMIATRDWANYREHLRALRQASTSAGRTVSDQRLQ